MKQFLHRDLSTCVELHFQFIAATTTTPREGRRVFFAHHHTAKTMARIINFECVVKYVYYVLNGAVVVVIGSVFTECVQRRKN